MIYKSSINFTSLENATYITTTTVTSFTDIGINQTTFYAVVAINSLVDSPVSNVVFATITPENPPPSIFEQFINQIIGFLMYIISLITGLLGIAIARRRSRAIDIGDGMPVECLTNPGLDYCKIE
jgi:hypothetical protein